MFYGESLLHELLLRELQISLMGKANHPHVSHFREFREVYGSEGDVKRHVMNITRVTCRSQCRIRH